MYIPCLETQNNKQTRKPQSPLHCRNGLFPQHSSHNIVNMQSIRICCSAPLLVLSNHTATHLRANRLFLNLRKLWIIKAWTVRSFFLRKKFWFLNWNMKWKIKNTFSHKSCLLWFSFESGQKSPLFDSHLLWIMSH